jgi:aminobutyraldehyde dehydrogenase
MRIVEVPCASIHQVDAAVDAAITAIPSCYYESTLIVDALQDDEVVQEEIFGPVVSVTRFKDTDQVIEWANYGKDLSMYGLEDYTVVRHIMVKI